MMSRKYLVVIEIIWIITGILCITGGIKYAINPGGSRTFIFFIMAAVSFLFAWVRHRGRKKS